MFHAAVPELRTWTRTSFSTSVFCTRGDGRPPFPDRSTESSQRKLPFAAQLAPRTCATEWEAANVTRICGVQAAPVQAAWASWHVGESYSTVAISASRG